MVRDLRTNPFQVYPRTLARLPRLIRLYIFHCMIGFVVSGIFTGYVIYANVANIGHLVMSVEGGILAAVVFFVLNGIVFAGVQTGIVVMSLAEPEDDDDGGRGLMVPAMQPVPVRLRK